MLCCSWLSAGVVEEEKNSRHNGSQFHLRCAKASCGVSRRPGAEEAMMSPSSRTAVERSERSSQSVEQGIGTIFSGGCHWSRCCKVVCRVESLMSKESSSDIVSLVGFARSRMLAAFMLSRRWPIFRVLVCCLSNELRGIYGLRKVDDGVLLVFFYLEAQVVHSAL